MSESSRSHVTLTTSGLTLLVPAKSDAERDAVSEAFEEAGGSVVRLYRFWEPPSLDPRCTKVYGNETFCLVVADILGLNLVSPENEFVVSLDEKWLGRRMWVVHLDQCWTLNYPVFVKPEIPKAFKARVYVSADDLFFECRGLPSDTRVVVSEPVNFMAEVRAFVLDGNILDVSPYEGKCDTTAARDFLSDLAQTPKTPRAVVLDAGLLESGRWVCIEANASWGAGLNGCDARRILPSIVAACEYGS